VVPRSRWRQVALALTALASTALATVLALDGTRSWASVPTSPPGEPWLVTEVIDGDTIDVAQGAMEMTVRLIGINAPEADECWSEEATSALGELVGAGPVWLRVDVTDLDQFGRSLRYVIDAAGDDVGALMVEQGAAIARSYPPDTANDDRYALLQEAARRDGRGLWAAGACGEPVASTAGAPVAVEIDLHPNAAGDDNVNLNDEWVRFTNTGSAPVDLTGWTVRDESSTHRYTFADLVLGPGAAVTLFTGCGVDSESARYWCNTHSAVWNNGGDTVLLLDPHGNVVVSRNY
jgi:endonuclease YncB( thermonuclease family)